jgi:pantoate--beta-alanine ligase
MRLIRTIRAMQRYSEAHKRKAKLIGFVPTMGYLHEGHLSLMRAARRDCDVSAISIFVNPTQFGPKEDFKKYPRDLKRDMRLAESVGVDVVFYPSVKEMYPEGFVTYVNVEGLSEGMCGTSRPGHFRGVATVVTKLFNAVQPDVVYFGQKDAQQAIIIKQLVRDLNMPIKVKILPIIREKDGLAMSSRNRYLSPKERIDALVLSQSLKKAREMVKSGIRSSGEIIRTVREIIRVKKNAKIDYIACVDAINLRPVSKIKGRVLIALAVWIGKTRLIDNIIVNV